MTKRFLLYSDGYIKPNGDYIIIDYNVEKRIDGHISEIAESLGLKEWFAIYLCGSYFTNCYTSSKRSISLTDIPSNEIAQIDCNWNNEPILLFAGCEENAGLKYSDKPKEKTNNLIESITVDYESLTNLKSIGGRTVKIKNPIHNYGIGGAWVEGIGDINVGSFSIVCGKDLIKCGLDADPDFHYEFLSFDYPTKNVVLDKESTLAIRALCQEAHNKRVELIKSSRPSENTITESERRRKEIEYDNLYNEGGEGYNPYRADETLPIIEPQDA